MARKRGDREPWAGYWYEQGRRDGLRNFHNPPEVKYGDEARAEYDRGKDETRATVGASTVQG